MAKPFLELREDLRERLLRAGVAPRHIRRYLAELTDHLADLTAEEERAGRNRADAESAALGRLGGTDTLARAMIEQRQFQSWCARAPWATFGLAPVAFLAAAWFIFLFLLWLGWQIFLPGAITPFGRHGTVAGNLFQPSNIYFQIDRAFYFGAPILVGWGIAFVAVRQRLKAAWPLAGMVLIALVAGASIVRANRAIVPGPAHIDLVFNLAPSVQAPPFGLFQALVILSLTALPYLVWRSRKTNSLHI